MMPKSFFRWVAWLLLIAIAVFTLSPIELRPTTAAPADVERFVAFVATGIAFGFGYPKHRAIVLVLLIACIGLLEVSQNLVPGRHGRFPDAVVKASGLFLGIALDMLISRHKPKS
jgi:VanZ family protein